MPLQNKVFLWFRGFCRLCDFRLLPLYGSVSHMPLARDVSNEALHQPSAAGVSASTEARLRALDAMLGGVAHDLNNALSVVLIESRRHATGSGADGKTCPPHQRHARCNDQGVDLGASSAQFFACAAAKPEMVSVAEILASLVELLQVAVGKEIEIVVEAADGIGPCCVIVDRATFEIGFTHAALQLAATMPGGGALFFGWATMSLATRWYLHSRRYRGTPMPRRRQLARLTSGFSGLSARCPRSCDRDRRNRRLRSRYPSSCLFGNHDGLSLRSSSATRRNNSSDLAFAIRRGS